MIERIAAEGSGTGNWSSRLHTQRGSDGCRLFELEVSVHITPVPAGTYTFETHDSRGERIEASVSIRPWTDADVDRFWTEFQRCVYDGWNDKLWLVHSGAVSGCYHGYTQTFENIKCGVKLTRAAEANAQLRVMMLYDPRPLQICTPDHPDGNLPNLWRSNCALGGSSLSWFEFGDNPVDMKVASTDTRAPNPPWYWTTSDHGTTAITQIVVQHEFGHYLGLSHACASAGVLNSSSQYCIGTTLHQMQDMMAVGSEVRAWHARAWLNRLPRHRYWPEMRFTWTARTSPPPPAPAESCPGPRRGLTMGVPAR